MCVCVCDIQADRQTETEIKNRDRQTENTHLIYSRANKNQLQLPVALCDTCHGNKDCNHCQHYNLFATATKSVSTTCLPRQHTLTQRLQSLRSYRLPALQPVCHGNKDCNRRQHYNLFAMARKIVIIASTTICLPRQHKDCNHRQHFNPVCHGNKNCNRCQ